MKRKTIALMAGMLLGVSLTGGCAATPEDALIKQKGKASLKNYEEAETPGAPADEGNADDESVGAGDGSGDILRQSLGAPEHYQSEAADATGKLQVLTDADVEIPDVSKVSAIAVSAHPFGQSVIDQVTEVFFPDAKIYTMDSYNEMTQADYQAEIEKLKGYVSEGNLDPYNWGTDENGNYLYDIYAVIEQLEQNYENAPRERNLTEAHPQYGLTEDDGKGGTFTRDDSFFGVACQPDGLAFDYIIKSYGSMDMELRIERIREQVSMESQIMWNEYDSLKANEEQAWPDEGDMPREAGITLEEARQIADEKAAGLQLEHMELAAWEYGICCEFIPSESKQNMLDAGYIFHYTRKLNGIPVTFTSDWGGNLEDMDSEMETWCYEVLDIIVTEDGVDTVNYNNPYDIGEVRTENLSLLPFDEVMEIYEKMMLIQNASALNYAISSTYHIDRITFGYTRIYEPSTDSRVGLLVPVWDFFGSNDLEMETDAFTSVSRYLSYLTVNAIDGSIISRGLGY